MKGISLKNLSELEGYTGSIEVIEPTSGIYKGELSVVVTVPFGNKEACDRVASKIMKDCEGE